MVIMQSNAQLQDAPVLQRDVSSTAKLFNFSRPVYMSESVWKDCVELVDASGRIKDELSVLQRLRHVLFMASSALHGRVSDVECEFNIHRVPNGGDLHRPEQTTLKLVATSSDGSPLVTIKHPNE